MSRQRWNALATAVGVSILAVVVYLPGLPGDFVYDDHRLIVDNDGFKRPFDPGRAFLRDYYASDLDPMGLGYYRPVTVLSKEFDYRRGGGGSLSFHVTNITVHVGSTLLVLALAWMLLGTGIAAACGAALFAVHASHAESVAFISGRVDPLATFFVLGAMWCHLRENRSPSKGGVLRWVAAASWLAALMCKEMAVTGPLLILFVETAEAGFPRREALWKRARRYLPYACAVVVYLPLRIAALGHLLTPSGSGLAPSLVKPMLVIGSYLVWLVLPPPGLHLEPAPVGGIAAVAACVFTVAVLGGSVALWRIGWRREAALVCGIVTALLPVAQIKPLETFLSERFLYLPSSLAGLLVASLVWRGFARQRSVGIAVALAMSTLALIHVAILEPRVATWRDEAALWTTKEVEDGGSLKARLNLAHVYARRGEREESLRWYALVKEIAPALAAGLDAEIGALTGDIASDDTETAIRKALEAQPEDGSLWNNLGFHLFKKGDANGAAAAFERSISLTPNRANGWLGLALARLSLRQFGLAEQAAARAAAIDPQLGLARAILAECALRDSRPCDALRLSQGITLTDPSEQAMLDAVVAVARNECPGGARSDGGE